MHLQYPIKSIANPVDPTHAELRWMVAHWLTQSPLVAAVAEEFDPVKETLIAEGAKREAFTRKRACLADVAALWPSEDIRPAEVIGFEVKRTLADLRSGIQCGQIATYLRSFTRVYVVLGPQMAGKDEAFLRKAKLPDECGIIRVVGPDYLGQHSITLERVAPRTRDAGSISEWSYPRLIGRMTTSKRSGSLPFWCAA